MSSDDFSNSDVDDPIDEMFDYNNDGQLDSGERANENAYYANGGSFPKDIVNSTKKKDTYCRSDLSSGACYSADLDGDSLCGSIQVSDHIL